MWTNAALAPTIVLIIMPNAKTFLGRTRAGVNMDTMAKMAFVKVRTCMHCGRK